MSNFYDEDVVPIKELVRRRKLRNERILRRSNTATDLSGLQLLNLVERYVEDENIALESLRQFDDIVQREIEKEIEKQIADTEYVQYFLRQFEENKEVFNVKLNQGRLARLREKSELKQHKGVIDLYRLLNFEEIYARYVNDTIRVIIGGEPFNLKSESGLLTAMILQSAIDTNIRNVHFLATVEYKETDDKGFRVTKARTFGSTGLYDQKMRKVFTETDVLKLYYEIQNFFEIFVSGNDIELVGLTVDVLKRGSRGHQGGCNPFTKHKHVQTTISSDGQDIIVLEPGGQPKHNNCFFHCFDMEKKLTIGECNKIRKTVGLCDNCMIPLDKIREIGLIIGKPLIEVFDPNGETLLRCEVNTFSEDFNLERIILHKDHYYGFKSKPKKCEKCLASYIYKHSEESCLNRQNHQNKKYQTKIISKRNVIDGYLKINKEPKKSKKGKEIDINKKLRSILHYDLEAKPDSEEVISNEVYKSGRFDVTALGLAYYETDTDDSKIIYKVFTSNVMKSFIDFLDNESPLHLKYLNAFNGKGFDHFFVVNEFLNNRSNKLSSMKLMINNGSISKGNMLKLQFVDISRFTEGTLASNLQALGCKVQKGDIDYNKIDFFDKMSPEMCEKTLKYLESDVRGLMQLTEKLVIGQFEESGMFLFNHFSNSHLAYEILRNKYLKSEHDIYAPSKLHYDFISKSVYGGKTLSDFFSKDITPEMQLVLDQTNDKASTELYMGDKDVYTKLVDYLIDLDAVSLYPAAMMKRYPIGKPMLTDKEIDGKMGIYNCRWYNPNWLENEDRNMKYFPMVPARKPCGKLSWNEQHAEGIYTSVDIEEGRKNGYIFEVGSGMYWDKSANIFEEYINYYFDKKSKAEKGTALYLICKLMMNGLFGKMIQKPIMEETHYFDTVDDIYTYVLDDDRYITDLIEVNNTYVVKSKSHLPQENDNCVTKPSYLGSFILSYSRQLMNNFYNQLNPDKLDEFMPKYGDTDSLIMHQKVVNDQTKHLLGSELGELSFDLKSKYGEAKIIRNINCAAKLYVCDYLVLIDDEQAKYTNKDCEKKDGKLYRNGELVKPEVVTVMRRHLRAKGVSKGALNNNLISYNSFIKMSDGEIHKIEKHNDNFSFRRIHVKTKNNGSDQPFTIVKELPTKELFPNRPKPQKG